MFPQGDAPVNAYCGIDAALNDVKCAASWPEPGQAARCSAASYQVGVNSAPLSTSQVTAIKNHVTASDSEFYWGTPLSTALNAAIKAQRDSAAPGAKSVILFTDGNPTSCGDVGISNDVSHVVNAATSGLSGTLVRTFVIGIVDGARQAAKAENLSPVAVAGGTKRFTGCEATNECFYAVTQSNFAADLKKIFEEISLQAFDCTFNLPAASATTDPNKINVQVDDGTGAKSVGQDTSHQNGWDYLPNGTQIQLYGQACTDMKSEKAKLSVVLGCKTIVAESSTR
jgi:von Willebrand factor type A domain